MLESAPKIILLVEDEAILAMSEKMALEQYGYMVKTAASGEKAIQTVASEPALDLILMDIDLGKGIDGTQAAEIILKNHDIPIVFVSSHSEREIVEKTEKITSYGYVVKSSSVTVLDASIKMAFKLFDAIKRERKKEADLIESKKVIQKKLNALTLFETSISDLELADIIDVDTIQSLMDDFYVFTGFPVAIIDLAGKVLVQTGWQDICTKFHRMHPETLKNCIECDTILSQNVPAGEFKSYLCKNNLWDNVTPLMIGGNHIGNLFTGQFFYEGEKPDDSVFLSQAAQYGFDEKEYMDAMRRVPLWKRDVANIGLGFYAKLAHTISSLSLANLSLAKSLGEQKTTGEILKTSESRWYSLVNNIPDFISILDEENRFLFLNHYAEGFSEKDVLGKSVFDFLSRESRDAFEEGITKCRKTHEIQRFEHTALGDNSKMREYDDHIISIADHSGFSNIIIVSRDITERKKMERALFVSEERYRNILQTAMDGYWLCDIQGTILDVNEAYCRMSGYSKEELLTMSISDIVFPERASEINGRIQRIIRNGSERFDSSHRRKDGSILDIEVSVQFLTTEGDHIVSFFRDISERKKTESEKEAQRVLMATLMDTSPVGITTVDAGGSITYANYRAEQILGIQKSEITGKKYNAPSWNPTDIDGGPFPDDRQPFSVVKNTGKSTYDIRHGITWSNGRWVLLSVNASPTFDQAGDFSGMIATFEDITEKANNEKTIVKQLEEKTILLKEVHHRIKNNMNTIRSLLSLQAQIQKEPSAKALLGEVGNRIRSMSLLYDKLYRSADFTNISVKDYLPDLVDEIIGNFPNKNSVTVKKQFDDFCLDAKRLQPLGIIINELLTNIMKHAFSGSEAGLIMVSATNRDGTATIAIQDDGNGMPASISFKDSTGFGLQLVEGLTQQLKGTIRVERENGTKIVIEFRI